MGSGASMEERPPQYGGPSTHQDARINRSQSARGYSARSRPPSSKRPRSAISAGSRRSERSASWKEAIKSGSLERSDSRRERAIALGRNYVVIILIK
jgi:hypothetical protein